MAERATFEDRFWGKVDLRSPGGCWIWTGSRNAKGYGVIRCPDSRNRKAHRVSWELHTGQAPRDGQDVCHTCDNPPCVNPAHLFVGTRSDNMRDMSRKGRAYFQAQPERAPRGEGSSRAKLTTADVVAIRESPLGCRRLARLFGVDRSTIQNIRNRRSWAHVA